MAEIHVQPKKKTTPVWIWIVLALVVLAAIAFLLLRNKKTNQNNVVNKAISTSLIQTGKPAEEIYYT